MSGLIGRFAPTAVVAAVVAWCCWPYLSGPGSDAGVQQSEEVLEIADSLLSPAIEAASDRDPFQPLEENETVAAQADAAQIEEPITPADQQPRAEVEPVDILHSLVLDATFIHGDRRLALINGRVYGQGESLAISNSATGPCMVAQISVDKVLIEYQGRTVELKYRDHASMAKPSGPVGATDQTPQETGQTAVP